MSKNQNKLCFIIMGYGKKQDPASHRSIDLDETYKKIIRPAVTSMGFTCVRGDEVSDSGMIDRSMFALLLNAQLVIADISTYNPNALYELGIRHAVKPYSTIIIKEQDGNIPFDISHTRTLNYKHLGNEISSSESKKSIKELKEIIKNVTDNPITDSPLYSYIPKVVQPVLSEEDFEEIVGELRTKENTIYALMENAKSNMSEGNFSEAAKKWKALSERVENETFFIQQNALCTYKSKQPNKTAALMNALTIISSIKNPADTETFGITGAIYKNLWRGAQDLSYLELAIENYKKGYNLFNDYYTAENYAHCLEQKFLHEKDPENKIYLKVEAKLTRAHIIEIILPSLNPDNGDVEEVKWKSATLSNCYKAIGDEENANKYEESFLREKPVDWEIETFNQSKKELEVLLAWTSK